MDLAKLSVPEGGRRTPAPRVGAVLARNGDLLGESYRGATAPGDHAEYALLERGLTGMDLSGATVFTTLEPCSRRNDPDKVPCAQRLINRGVSTVFIGMYDPNPVIYREGWRLLRDAGVLRRDFSPELRAEIYADNSDFIDSFRVAVGESGNAAFDYRQNAGRFDIRSAVGNFTTGWAMRGPGSIHALDNEHHVAIARYARVFEDIDDPAALDFSKYTVPVDEGEIAVFRNGTAFALVRIRKVFAGPRWGQDHWELQFEYEVRSPMA